MEIVFVVGGEKVLGSFIQDLLRNNFEVAVDFTQIVNMSTSFVLKFDAPCEMYPRQCNAGPFRVS